MFKNKSILITGGTGTLGNACVNYLLQNHNDIRRIIIYSRDEQKHFLMEKIYPTNIYPQMRYLIGDIRDKERLIRAFENVDYVIHAAAMKHVHLAEYHPDECVKTNVNGAKNVIDAALKTNVKKVVALSTDKACSPINLYGATKLVSDKLFVAANNITGNKKLNFSVVRYGNVMASNGSVIPFFVNNKKLKKDFPITDPKMTRFNIKIEDGVKMIMFAFKYSTGGEIFVPKIPSYNIIDLANAICEKTKKNIVGIRPGEKLHEEMISSSDSYNTYDLGKYYIIIPNNESFSMDIYKENFTLKKVDSGFCYNSGTNDNFLSVKDLRKLLQDLNLI